MECRLAKPEWCVRSWTKRSTGGHTGIGNCGQCSSGIAACPRHLYPVSSMNVPKSTICIHFRRRTRQRMHPVRHRVSRFCPGRSGMASKCERMRSRIGKVKRVSSQSGNYKHTAHVGHLTCFVIGYQALESTFMLQLHLVPSYSDRMIARY